MPRLTEEQRALLRDCSWRDLQLPEGRQALRAAGIAALADRDRLRALAVRLSEQIRDDEDGLVPLATSQARHVNRLKEIANEP